MVSRTIPRRLEARIRKLCQKALRAEQQELESVFQELRGALHEHNELLRSLVAGTLGHPWPYPDPTLRKKNVH